MIKNKFLDQKVSVITGASRGIGFATAKLFAENGSDVVLIGRSEESLKNACLRIEKSCQDAKISMVLCDVSDPRSVRDAFQKIYKSYKKLNVLVCNAGILEDALIGMVTPSQIEKTFGINTFGTIYCVQSASRLIARSNGGSIINISSIIGRTGNVGQTVYGGSKAAIIGITQSLAKELAPQAVRVNAIAPGFIDTDMARSISNEKFAERLASIKMGRIGSAEEVANVALFLASDMSSYVTGQVIGVDGGMLI